MTGTATFVGPKERVLMWESVTAERRRASSAGGNRRGAEEERGRREGGKNRQDAEGAKEGKGELLNVPPIFASSDLGFLRVLAALFLSLSLSFSLSRVLAVRSLQTQRWRAWRYFA